MPEAPWDTSPSSQAQHDYVRELLGDLVNVDWSQHNTTTVSEAITKLNTVRRSVGIKFRPF
jgi:hypothetical protein